MSLQGQYVFDIETNGLLDTVTKIHCLVLLDTKTKEVTTYGDFEGATGKLLEGLVRLSNAEVVIGHYIVRYDIPVIKKFYRNFRLKGSCIDTALLSKLLYPNILALDYARIKNGTLDGKAFKPLIGHHSLKAWGYRLGVLKGTFGEENNWETFSNEMLEYCIQDCRVTHSLVTKLWKELPSKESLVLEQKTAEIIHEQVQFGWEFDTEDARELYALLCDERLKLQQKLKEVMPTWYVPMKTPEYYHYSHPSSEIVFKGETKAECFISAYSHLSKKMIITKKAIIDNIQPGPIKRRKIEFNPGSRHHACRALKERYNWVPTVFTKKGEVVVNETVLESLEYPEAVLLREYFIIQKRIGQIAEGEQAWLSSVKGTRIHGELDTLGASTHRATHNTPNLAQVPALDKKYGKECRALFTVPEGYLLVGTDAKGQELRALAHYLYPYDGGSFARTVVEGRQEDGTDVHTITQKAIQVYTRAQAKRFIYAWLYGAGDEMIGEIIGKGPAEGKAIKELFLKKNPALKYFLDDLNQEAKSGYIIGLDGRRLPVDSKHKALNYKLQGCGAILTKRWMIIIRDEITKRGWTQQDATQVGWIHDELQFQVRENLVDEMAAICKDAMVAVERFYDFKCPLSASVGIGKNWAGTH